MAVTLRFLAESFRSPYNGCWTLDPLNTDNGMRSASIESQRSIRSMERACPPQIFKGLGIRVQRGSLYEPRVTDASTCARAS